MARVDLAGTPASVAVARRRVQEAMRQAAAAEEANDTGQLLVTELMTNAVLHARTDVRLGVEVVHGVLRVEVTDRSPQIPRMRRHARTAASGRGLRLVAELATAWGVEQHDDGKTVWFTLDVHRVVATGQGGFDRDSEWWADVEAL